MFVLQMQLKYITMHTSLTCYEHQHEKQHVPGHTCCSDSYTSHPDAILCRTNVFRFVALKVVSLVPSLRCEGAEMFVRIHSNLI